MTQIGEDPWSKPQVFDIVLYFNSTAISIDQKIEVSIEELYKPLDLKQASIKKESWVPHKVVYVGIVKYIKSNKLVLRNIPYETAYFLDSIIYQKQGFRVVAIIYNKNEDHVYRIDKSFTYSM